MTVSIQATYKQNVSHLSFVDCSGVASILKHLDPHVFTTVWGVHERLGVMKPDAALRPYTRRERVYTCRKVEDSERRILLPSKKTFRYWTGVDALARRLPQCISAYSDIPTDSGHFLNNDANMANLKSHPKSKRRASLEENLKPQNLSDVHFVL
jgi:hypothetical protein